MKTLSKQTTQNSPFGGFRGLVLLLLWGVGGLPAAFAQATVTPVGVDYDRQEVKFRVAWNAATAANNRVWVWVDFCSVAGTTPGTFAPATITSASVTSGAPTDLNGRGFYVTANGATVTAQLNATGQFNWCAYASDYPPNATIGDGTYTLKGSPPFKITYNGSSYIETSDKSFTLGCIASLTDATGCPGIINYPAFSAGALGNGSWGRMGEFLNVGGTPLGIVSATTASGGSGKITYKWYKNNAEISGATATTYLPPKADAAAAGTFNYTRKAYDGVCNTAGTIASGTWINVVGGPIHSYTGCSIDVAKYDISQLLLWTEADAACKSLGSGWRLPTASEGINCLGPYRFQLNLIEPTPVADRTYWESTTTTPTGGPPECIGRASHTFLHIKNYDEPDWYVKPDCDKQWCNDPTWGYCESIVSYTRCVKDK
ncbi:MAG: hypothetical protein LBU42_06125 [Prevotellaceae bacterium]|jgi:hypothetical protein|nr:hypothetical protein [Prevotellaceae bacterium]